MKPEYIGAQRFSDKNSTNGTIILRTRNCTLKFALRDNLITHITNFEKSFLIQENDVSTWSKQTNYKYWKYIPWVPLRQLHGKQPMIYVCVSTTFTWFPVLFNGDPIKPPGMSASQATTYKHNTLCIRQVHANRIHYATEANIKVAWVPLRQQHANWMHYAPYIMAQRFSTNAKKI